MEPKGIGIVMKQERDQSYATNLLRDTFSPQGLQMVILEIAKMDEKDSRTVIYGSRHIWERYNSVEGVGVENAGLIVVS